MNIPQDINICLLKRMAASGADLALPDGSRATDVTQEPAPKMREAGLIKQAT